MSDYILRALGALALVVVLSGCATTETPYDYSAFQAAKPRSILVMPPLNNSPDVKATNGVWAQTIVPLAESGYYVVPISLVAETLRENGLANAPEAHQANPAKLREFFGADAALYLNVKEYGSSYRVIVSETRVTVEAKLVDLRNNATLWEGSARASSAEQQNSGGGGLLGALVGALVQQVIASATDASYPMAGLANQRLLAAGRPRGMLFGPRSPEFGKDAHASR